MNWLIRTQLGFLLLGLAACPAWEQNASFCEASAPEDDLWRCEDGTVCVDNRCVERLECTSDCAGQICDLSAGQCRPCETDQQCTTEYDLKRCNADGICVECTGNQDCTDSGLCYEGACTPAATTFHVSKDAASTGPSCTLTQPCTTISAALALASAGQTPYFITVAGASGTYSESVTITGKHITLLGPGTDAVPNATVNPNQDDVPGLLVTANSNVFVSGIAFTGATSTATSDADGIRAVGSDLTLQDVTMFHNSNQGLDFEDGTLVVTRTQIGPQNYDGGIELDNATFTIENTLIVDNGGGAASSFGGVDIRGNIGVGSSIAYSTLANNINDSGNGFGLNCTAIGTASIDNVIVYNPFGAANQVTGTACIISNSLVFMDEDARFSADPNLDDDYKLEAGSPCIDEANASDAPATDFEGDPRPQGNAPDIGADELAQ